MSLAASLLGCSLGLDSLFLRCGRESLDVAQAVTIDPTTKVSAEHDACRLKHSRIEPASDEPHRHPWNTLSSLTSRDGLR